MLYERGNFCRSVFLSAGCATLILTTFTKVNALMLQGIGLIKIDYPAPIAILCKIRICFSHHSLHSILPNPRYSNLSHREYEWNIIRSQTLYGICLCV